MKVTFGILAHVDAGKTTFSEQVLFRSGLIRSLGRVDSGNSFMDCHEVERERGITVFSEQAVYRRGEDTYYLIVILSILVDTFCSRISLSMPPIPKSHNTACVLS